MQYVIAILVILGLTFSIYAKASTASQSKPMIELSRFLSGNDEDVSARIDVYLKNPTDYFITYKDDLLQRGIEEPSGITKAVVLVDSLMSKNHIVYLDGSTEPDYALSRLNELSQNILSQADAYEALSEKFSKTKYGIGAYLDSFNDDPTIFSVCKSRGLALVSIDENSDSYPLLVLPLDELDNLTKLAKSANISFYYLDK